MNDDAFHRRGTWFIPTLVLLVFVGHGHDVLAANPARGAGIYTNHCAVCHSPSGHGVMPGAPNLARGDRLQQSDAALLSSIKAGRNAMPGYQGILSDLDLLDVIAYLRTLH